MAAYLATYLIPTTTLLISQYNPCWLSGDSVPLSPCKLYVRCCFLINLFAIRHSLRETLWPQFWYLLLSDPLAFPLWNLSLKNDLQVQVNFHLIPLDRSTEYTQTIISTGFRPSVKPHKWTITIILKTNNSFNSLKNPQQNPLKTDCSKWLPCQHLFYRQSTKERKEGSGEKAQQPGAFLVLQRTWTLTPTWWTTSIHNFSSKEVNSLFWPPQIAGKHTTDILTYIPQKNFPKGCTHLYHYPWGVQSRFLPSTAHTQKAEKPHQHTIYRHPSGVCQTV